MNSSCPQISTSPKRRLHEQSYAQKVVQTISLDKTHVKLNESLFNAQITGKQSASMIKEIQKDVKLTLKKYDNLIQSLQSNKQSQYSEQNSFKIIKPQLIQQEEEKSLSQLKQEEQILLDQLQHMSQQNSLERLNLRLSSFKAREDLFPIDNISPIKIKECNTVSRRKSTIISQIPDNTNGTSIFNCLTGSYAKIHQKKGLQRPSSTTELPIKQPDVAQRNIQWKQRLKEKINQEQQLQQVQELKNCTFKPKILQRQSQNNIQTQESNLQVFQKQNIQKNNNIKSDIKEIMNIIDDLNIFNKKLKQKF